MTRERELLATPSPDSFRNYAELEGQAVAVLFNGHGTANVEGGLSLCILSKKAHKIYKTLDSGKYLPTSFKNIPPFDLTDPHLSELGLVAFNISGLETIREFPMDIGAFAGLGTAGVISAMIASGAMKLREGYELADKIGYEEKDAAKGHGMLRLTASANTPEELMASVIETIFTEENDTPIAIYIDERDMVFAGEMANLTRAKELIAAKYGLLGIRAGILHIDGAHSSPRMKRILRESKEAIDKLDIQAPQSPILSCTTGEFIETPEQLKEELIASITNPALLPLVEEEATRRNMTLIRIDEEEIIHNLRYNRRKGSRAKTIAKASGIIAGTAVVSTGAIFAARAILNRRKQATP